MCFTAGLLTYELSALFSAEETDSLPGIYTSDIFVRFNSITAAGPWRNYTSFPICTFSSTVKRFNCVSAYREWSVFCQAYKWLSFLYLDFPSLLEFNSLPSWNPTFQRMFKGYHFGNRIGQFNHCRSCIATGEDNIQIISRTIYSFKNLFFLNQSTSN